MTQEHLVKLVRRVNPELLVLQVLRVLPDLRVLLDPPVVQGQKVNQEHPEVQVLLVNQADQGLQVKLVYQEQQVVQVRQGLTVRTGTVAPRVNPVTQDLLVPMATPELQGLRVLGVPPVNQAIQEHQDKMEPRDNPDRGAIQETLELLVLLEHLELMDKLVLRERLEHLELMDRQDNQVLTVNLAYPDLLVNPDLMVSQDQQVH